MLYCWKGLNHLSQYPFVKSFFYPLETRVICVEPANNKHGQEISVSEVGLNYAKLHKTRIKNIIFWNKTL